MKGCSFAQGALILVAYAFAVVLGHARNELRTVCMDVTAALDAHDALVLLLKRADIKELLSPYNLEIITTHARLLHAKLSHDKGNATLTHFGDNKNVPSPQPSVTSKESRSDEAATLLSPIPSSADSSPPASAMSGASKIKVGCWAIA